MKNVLTLHLFLYLCTHGGLSNLSCEQLTTGDPAEVLITRAITPITSKISVGWNIYKQEEYLSYDPSANKLTQLWQEATQRNVVNEYCWMLNISMPSLTFCEFCPKLDMRLQSIRISPELQGNLNWNGLLFSWFYTGKNKISCINGGGLSNIFYNSLLVINL